MDSFLILFIILILYVIILLILRAMGIGAKQECNTCKNCCPDCKNSLKRIKRKEQDHVLHLITLKLFAFKRYTCENCAWEGLRWEKAYQG